MIVICSVGPSPTLLLGTQEYGSSSSLSCMLLISTLPPLFETSVLPRLMVYVGAGYPSALHVRVTVVPGTTALPGVPVVKIVFVGRSMKIQPLYVMGAFWLSIIIIIIIIIIIKYLFYIYFIYLPHKNLQQGTLQIHV